jgi:hypothetical protein
MLAPHNKTYADHWLLLANIIAMPSQAHAQFAVVSKYE